MIHWEGKGGFDNYYWWYLGIIIERHIVEPN
jgi:hypothetical protein